MVRVKPPPQIGSFYHVYNRGNNRDTIFFDRENYLYFLRLLRQKLVNSGVEIIAYCLMPNHYHLLIQMQTEQLAAPMKALSLAYTKAINERFKRVGALFQGRYQSILVERDDYLVHLTRYVHLNPVKAGLVEHPADWEFSSYLDYVGQRAGTLPNLAIVREQLGCDDRTYQELLTSHTLPAEYQFQRLMLDE